MLSNGVAITRGKQVFIATTFKKIGEIDTAKECFSAEVLIQAKWREESLDGYFNQDVSGINFDRLWNPKLYVSNLLSEVKDVTSNTVIFNNNNGSPAAYVLSQKRLKGVYLENLELQDFPFDIQDLTITVSSELQTAEIEMLIDEELLSSVNTYSFVDEQEWKLWTEVRVERGETESIVVGGRSFGTKHPYMNFKCTAERRYQYFLWNVVFILTFICLMSFTIFAVKPTKTENRMQLTFILLLTTVAFKTNINNSLPKISYLTSLDKYILASWVIQCVLCVWHAIVGNLYLDVPDGQWIDRGFLICSISIYFFVQVFYFIYVCLKIAKKRKSIGRATTKPLESQGENYNLKTRSTPSYRSLYDSDPRPPSNTIVTETDS